ncbi:MAG TPA: ABC transporter permease [Eoetvoesiella sp.]|uniref:cell division protein FtsX n=1 Tax=Eoetvoesiella sp. TaxID=1966355 RepID=UPI002C4C25AF|nr:ABC transporter permease [Eoetvoesiella sp.]HWK62013.1 ABC transporter permease [Eoetvoesiella sp.]
MRRWLRHHRYAFLVAVRRLLSQPFSSLSNMLVIALTLATPILTASILISAQPVARQVSVSPEVTLFLKPDAPSSTAQQIAARLQADYAEKISAVRIAPRAQIYSRLKQDPAWADALAALPGNPLPDAVVITLKEQPDLARDAAALVQEWKKWREVDRVQHDSAWVQRLDAILGFVRVGLSMLAAVVALVVLATVFNTVRLQALSQREEIAVARLVGATEAFVRLPFLYLGALTGIVSGVAAVILAALALTPLNAALARLASSYGTQLALQLPDALSLALAVVVVAILGALAARWSVTRNTRF